MKFLRSFENLATTLKFNKWWHHALGVLTFGVAYIPYPKGYFINLYELVTTQAVSFNKLQYNALKIQQAVELVNSLRSYGAQLDANAGLMLSRAARNANTVGEIARRIQDLVSNVNLLLKAQDEEKRRLSILIEAIINSRTEINLGQNIDQLQILISNINNVLKDQIEATEKKLLRALQVQTLYNPFSEDDNSPEIARVKSYIQTNKADTIGRWRWQLLNQLFSIIYQAKYFLIAKLKYSIVKWMEKKAVSGGLAKLKNTNYYEVLINTTIVILEALFFIPEFALLYAGKIIDVPFLLARRIIGQNYSDLDADESPEAVEDKVAEPEPITKSSVQRIDSALQNLITLQPVPAEPRGVNMKSFVATSLKILLSALAGQSSEEFVASVEAVLNKYDPSITGIGDFKVDRMSYHEFREKLFDICNAYENYYSDPELIRNIKYLLSISYETFDQANERFTGDIFAKPVAVTTQELAQRIEEVQVPHRDGLRLRYASPEAAAAAVAAEEHKPLLAVPRPSSPRPADDGSHSPRVVHSPRRVAAEVAQPVVLSASYQEYKERTHELACQYIQSMVFNFGQLIKNTQSKADLENVQIIIRILNKQHFNQLLDIINDPRHSALQVHNLQQNPLFNDYTKAKDFIISVIAEMQDATELLHEWCPEVESLFKQFAQNHSQEALSLFAIIDNAWPQIKTAWLPRLADSVQDLLYRTRWLASWAQAPEAAPALERFAVVEEMKDEPSAAAASAPILRSVRALFADEDPESVVEPKAQATDVTRLTTIEAQIRKLLANYKLDNQNNRGARDEEAADFRLHLISQFEALLQHNELFYDYDKDKVFRIQVNQRSEEQSADQQLLALFMTLNYVLDINRDIKFNLLRSSPNCAKKVLAYFPRLSNRSNEILQQCLAIVARNIHPEAVPQHLNTFYGTPIDAAVAQFGAFQNRDFRDLVSENFQWRNLQRGKGALFISTLQGMAQEKLDVCAELFTKLEQADTLLRALPFMMGDAEQCYRLAEARALSNTLLTYLRDCFKQKMPAEIIQRQIMSSLDWAIRRIETIYKQQHYGEFSFYQQLQKLNTEARQLSTEWELSLEGFLPPKQYTELKFSLDKDMVQFIPLEKCTYLKVLFKDLDKKYLKANGDDNQNRWLNSMLAFSKTVQDELTEIVTAISSGDTEQIKAGHLRLLDLVRWCKDEIESYKTGIAGYPKIFKQYFEDMSGLIAHMIVIFIPDAVWNDPELGLESHDHSATFARLKDNLVSNAAPPDEAAEMAMNQLHAAYQAPAI